MELKDLERAKRIEAQVERWDLFAKMTPTIFLLGCFVLLALGVFEFRTVFYIGFGLFVVTAVTWWFWTIFSIRFLIRLFNKATNNLIEVSNELNQVKNEYKEIRDEENRHN